MNPISVRFTPSRHTTWADEIARDRRRRFIRAGALVALIGYAVWVTKLLIQVRHELRVARGEIRP